MHIECEYEEGAAGGSGNINKSHRVYGSLQGVICWLRSTFLAIMSYLPLYFFHLLFSTGEVHKNSVSCTDSQWWLMMFFCNWINSWQFSCLSLEDIRRCHWDNWKLIEWFPWRPGKLSVSMTNLLPPTVKVSSRNLGFILLILVKSEIARTTLHYHNCG